MKYASEMRNTVINFRLAWVRRSKEKEQKIIMVMKYPSTGLKCLLRETLKTTDNVKKRREK